MPTKRRNPVLSVLAYFETADLALAQQALALANAIVRRRTPVATKPKKETATPRKTPVRASDSVTAPN